MKFYAVAKISQIYCRVISIWATLLVVLWLVAAAAGAELAR